MAYGETYEEFVEKFKPKKTTDDCYTPKPIMDVVNKYVVDRWGLDPKNFVRPFWPGGDYQHFDYPEGCVVVDNPPFSIMRQILRFYAKNDIKFFLFCPGLTAFDCLIDDTFDVIVPEGGITYENKAHINTAFVTNLPTDFSVETSVDLDKKIKIANEENSKSKSLPKYIYPDYVLRSTEIKKFSKVGVEYKVKKGSCYRISKLESQKQDKKTIFGSGLLLSSGAAAEKVAAEKAAAEKTAAEKAAAGGKKTYIWELSDREKAIIEELNKKEAEAEAAEAES